MIDTRLNPPPLQMLVSNEAVHDSAVQEEEDLDEDDPFFDHLELQGEVEALEQARDVIAA